jgi:hypothetical protein
MLICHFAVDSNGSTQPELYLCLMSDSLGDEADSDAVMSMEYMTEHDASMASSSYSPSYHFLCILAIARWDVSWAY